MGSMVESYDVLARVILQALVNSFWPGLMLLLVAWLALRLIDRTNATTRHAIWVVCLCAIAVLPFLPAPKRAVPSLGSTVPTPLEPLAASLSRPAARISPIVVPEVSTRDEWRPSAVQPRLSVSDLTGLGVSNVESSALPSVVATERTATSEPQPISWSLASLLGGRVPGVLIAVWLMVASILSARISWSYLFLFRIRRRLGLVPAAHREQGRKLAEMFGIRRRVRIFTSPLVGAPMTIGWLRPLVILPPDLLRTLGDEELISVLAHELAHIKRLDYLTNLVHRLAQALLFFHPAVWVIGRQLSLERELACDDWAIKMTGEPRRYARCLTRLVENLSEPRSFAAATGIVFGKNIISRRIEMILNRERNATTSVPRTALFTAIGSAGLAVVLATLISPAIAVPLAPASQLAKAQGSSAQAPRPATPEVAPVETTSPVAVAPVVASRLQPPQSLRGMDAEAPLPPVGPDEPVFELLEALPPAPPEPVVFLPQWAAPVTQSVSYLQDRDPAVVAPAIPRGVFRRTQQTPAPAPRVRVASGASFDERNAQPAIPEAELLVVLTDVVRRDTDANVRAEALRGIYRFRSDAAVGALLSLYDTVPDVKTKGEILSYIMRSEGDNSKAIAKLLQIAKTEKDETLRSRALSQLAKVKGDDGANHLIQIYDTLQDPKEKQTVIRYLGYNKSRKAADKLIQIAKNDTDPTVRQSAIRSLYAIDNRLYLDLRERGFGTTGNKVSGLMRLEDLDRLRVEIDREPFVINKQAFEQQLQEAHRKMEELQQNLRELPEMKVAPELKSPRIK